MTTESRATERAAGALYGLAIGDALGMPTQSLPRPQIVASYGPLLQTFEPAPPGHPLAAGRPVGAVTDDTEQAILLARLVIDQGGKVDAAELARQLVGWEESMRARGSLDLLGPSTKRAIGALLAGVDVDQAGRSGVTNGAAMRITPVAIAAPSADLDGLVDRVVEASRATHNTGVALAGAAAVAAAVSAGLDGAAVPDASRLAVAAAQRAARRGHWVAAADVAARITWATGLAADLAGRPGGPYARAASRTEPGNPLNPAFNGTQPAQRHIERVPHRGGSADRVAWLIDTVYTLVGTSMATQESVPAAFAVLAACPDDPWLACRIAASLGGDCDTIAAMTGAIGGACHGLAAFPEDARATVAEVNDLHLDQLAADLLAVRYAAAAGLATECGTGATAGSGAAGSGPGFGRGVSGAGTPSGSGGAGAAGSGPEFGRGVSGAGTPSGSGSTGRTAP